MAINMNNSLTNVELMDRISVLKGTFASRRLVLPELVLIISAGCTDAYISLERRLTFRRNVPMGDVKNIVRSYFKRGSYSGYPIQSVSISIGVHSEFTISNPDISDTELESVVLNV